MLMPGPTKTENKSPCLSSWVTQGHTWQGRAAGAKTWGCTALGNMWTWVMKEDANFWAYFSPVESNIAITTFCCLRIKEAKQAFLCLCQ